MWSGERERDLPRITRPQGRKESVTYKWRKVFQKVPQHVQSRERACLIQEFKLLSVTRLWATYIYREKTEELDRKVNRQGSENQLWRFPRVPGSHKRF